MSLSKRIAVALSLILAGVCAASTPAAHAATIEVTNTANNGAGSLRQAINDANDETAHPGADTITFDQTVFNTAKTITLGSALILSANVTITGPAAGVTLDGVNVTFHVFSVNSGVEAVFAGLTISNGYFGIANYGTATVIGSTLRANVYGIVNYGTATVTISTLSGNSTGIVNLGTATVTSFTMSGNSYYGIYNTGTLPLQNSIVAGNIINFLGTFTDNGNNLTEGDPMLGALQDNGGPTFTMLPAAGSPAVDAGNSDKATDQRGVLRPQGAFDDIGAVEVEVVNTAPTISDIAISTDKNTAFPFATNSFDGGFSDADAQDSLQKIKVTSLPAHGVLTLDGNDVAADDEIAHADLSKLFYTPNADYFGDDSFGYNGSDGEAYAVTGANVTITVNPIEEDNHPPTFTSPGDKIVDEGSDLSFTLEASDQDAGQTLTYSATGLPAGATLDPETGAFSWTPTEAQGGQVYTLTFTVNDGNSGGETSHTITITVNKVNSAPVLAAIGDKNVNEESQLAFTATATDSDLPTQTLTFSLAAGSTPVPFGAAITSGGNFTWTPNESQGGQSFNFKVRVSDGTITDEKDVAVAVIEINSAPVLPFVGARTVLYGVTTTYNFGAKDVDLPKNNLTYSLIGGPAGATINSFGMFSWTPTVAQAVSNNFYAFKVRVADNGSPVKSDEQSAFFTVLYPAEISVNPVAPSLKADGKSYSVSLTYTVRNNTRKAYSNLKVGGDVLWPTTLATVTLTPSAKTTATQSVLTISSKRITWNIPSLPAGASRTLIVKLTGVVPTNAAAKSKIASGFVLSPVSGSPIPNNTSLVVVLHTYK